MSRHDWIVDLDDWEYRDHFMPPSNRDSNLDPAVAEVEAYIARIALEEHRFFDIARRERTALRQWLAQELVMTNAFSQIVLAAASRIQNVHVRAILSEVAYGEHGRAKHGIARGAHPWLLHRLAQSVDLQPDDVRPADATVALIRMLEASVYDGPLSAVAWIGVGNERLIIPEYTAVQRCFSEIWPEATYEPFLAANLTEDVAHSRLCYEAATTLIHGDAQASDLYLAEAKASIDARYRYFDQLADAT